VETEACPSDRFDDWHQALELYRAGADITDFIEPSLIGAYKEKLIH
jgi:hypothetical protein